MGEKVAIVGSRVGADLDAVDGFVRSMWVHDPSIILISGGAPGVDKKSESLWLELGGQVWSFRVREDTPIRFSIERWELGSDEPSVQMLLNEPTFADRKSALFYRDALIAEHSDRVVCFYRRGRSAGTQLTADFAHAYGRDLHEYEAAA